MRFKVSFRANIQSERCLLIALILVFHKIKEIVVGQPEEGLLQHVLQVNLIVCKEICDKSPKCVLAKYNRLSKLCSLYKNDNDNNLQIPGVNLYTKPVENRLSDSEQCSTESVGHCGNPYQIPGTETFGNMVNVGSRIKYVCLDGSGSGISECFVNRSWSKPNLKCNFCVAPLNFTNKTLKNIITWTYKKVNETSVSIEAICESHCDIQQPVICNIETGRLFLRSIICCNDMGIQGSILLAIYYYARLS